MMILVDLLLSRPCPMLRVVKLPALDKEVTDVFPLSRDPSFLLLVPVLDPLEDLDREFLLFSLFELLFDLLDFFERVDLIDLAEMLLLKGVVLRC